MLPLLCRFFLSFFAAGPPPPSRAQARTLARRSLLSLSLSPTCHKERAHRVHAGPRAMSRTRREEQVLFSEGWRT